MKSGRLLPSGCGEKRTSKPIGFCLAGIADGVVDGSCFVGAQANSEHPTKSVFSGQPWASNFLRHAKTVSVYINSLTANPFPFTKRRVLNFRTTLPAKCPHVSGKVSNQRHPARTGAGNERLAMEANAHQAATFGGQSRFLKIEATGDVFLKKITPRIRLGGKWLERAGFKPGHRVEVRLEQPGTMRIQSLEQPKEPTL